ncbi:MAG: adenylate/guanylate cyclase domain-containing protein [Candidatus Ozemobacteraceae bacterium]
MSNSVTVAESTHEVFAPSPPSRRVALLAWFFILFLPALLFYRAMTAVIETEESARRTTVKNALAGEMADFLDELQPERRLKAAFTGIETELGFPVRLHDRGFQFERGAEAAFRPTSLTPRLLAGMRSRIGTVPLFLMVAGPDCREIQVVADTRLIPPSETPAPWLVQPLLVSNAGITDRNAWEDQSFVNSQKERWRDSTGRRSLDFRVTAVCRGLFDAEPMIGLPWRESREFFSTRFGGGRFWIYASFVPASSRPHSPILGGYIAVFRDADLADRLFRNFDKGMPSSKGSQDRRGLTSRYKILTPRYLENDHWMAYLAPLTQNILHLDPQHRSNGTIGERRGIIPFVRAPATDFHHPLHPWLPWIRFGGIVLLIISGFFFNNFRTGMTSLPLRIREKLLVALVFAVALPVCAFWMLSAGYFEFSRRYEHRRLLDELSDRLEFLESLANGRALSRQQAVWSEKRKLGMLLDAPIASLTASLAHIRRLGAAEIGYLIRADGRELLLGPLPGKGTIPEVIRKKMTELSRVISLGIFQAEKQTKRIGEFVPVPGSVWTRGVQAMSDAVGFREISAILYYDGLRLANSIMGGLNESVTLFRVFDEKSSGVYRRKPPVVGESALDGTRFDGGGSSRLGALLYLLRPTGKEAIPVFEDLERRLSLFQEERNGYSRRFGIFQIHHEGNSASELTRCWPREAKNDHFLFEPAWRASQTGLGGPFVNGSGENIRLGAVRVFFDLPFVAVALAEPLSPRAEVWHFFLLMAGIGLYTLLILLLVTDFLSRVFIMPIRAIGAAGAAVAKGDFSVVPMIPSGDEFGELATEFRRLTAGLREGVQLRRFVSADVVSVVRSSDAGGKGLRPGGERAQVTILFSHISGFGEFVADQSPDVVFALLNEWLPNVEAAVLAEQGTIDKYIGEAAMAIFRDSDGNSARSDDLQDPAVRACRAALEMRRVLLIFNQKLRDTHRLPIRIGIGIAGGEVISGKIGSLLGRLDFTVIGDSVNLAARLESESRRGEAPQGLGSRILIDVGQMEIAAKVGIGPFKRLGAISVKGKLQPVEVAELVPE